MNKFLFFLITLFCISCNQVQYGEKNELGFTYYFNSISGDNSNIGAYSYVGCSGLITIGKNVMIGPRVNLMGENHNFDETNISMKSQGVNRSPIVIEDAPSPLLRLDGEGVASVRRLMMRGSYMRD